MAKFPHVGIAIGFVLVGAIGLLVFRMAGGRNSFPPKPPVSEVTAIAAIKAANPKEAERKFDGFVAKHESDPNPKVQDEVTAARMQVGFLAAHRGDLGAARATFQTAARKYRGTGTVGGDYGSLPDQAVYQSAVCLVAAGKREEARSEFVKFLKDRPFSPLVQAAYRRIYRLNGNRDDSFAVAILNDDVLKQGQRAALETSVCGPKAIAYLLPLLGRPTRDYHDIAKLCDTTGAGTTLEGMQKGLRSLGIETYGAVLDRRDLAKLPPPFIVLEADHYLVATGLTRAQLHVYDPRTGYDRDFPLPLPSDPTFQITVLAPGTPSLNSN
jgi:hypothetical protein